MTQHQSQIMFSLQDLLTQSPMSATFNEAEDMAPPRPPPQPRTSSFAASSYYGTDRNSIATNYSSGSGSGSGGSSTGSIVHTRVTMPPHHSSHSNGNLVKPLRLPKRPKFLKSKNSQPEHRQLNQLKPAASFSSLKSSSSSGSDTSPLLDQSQQATMAGSAPQIQPYVYSTAQSTRREKNLRGSTCCFCEEPLEHTMAGEKVISLKCIHVSHFECLSQMLDIESIGQNEEGPDGFPFCPTCDQIAQPMNPTLQHEIIKHRLLQQTSATSTSTASVTSPSWSSIHSPRTPMTASSIGYVTTPDSANSPAFVTPPKRKQLPPQQRLASVNENSRLSRVGMPPPPPPPHVPRQSAYRSTSSQSHRNKYSKQKRTCSLPPPNIEIVPEVEEFAPADQDDRYSSFLINVTVPNNIFSSRYKPTDQELRARDASAQRLKASIADWRRLNFDLFGRLRLQGFFHMSRDMSSWQEVTCYLFQTMLLCVRDYSYDLAGAKLGRSAYVKAAINLNRDLINASIDSQSVLRLTLSDRNVSSLCLSCQSPKELEAWHAGLIDPKLHFPYKSEPDAAMSPLFAPSDEEEPGMVTVARSPVDFVLAVPGTANEHKWVAVKQTICAMLSQMGQLDRLGVIIYGHESYAVPLQRRSWDQWATTIESLRPLSNVGGDLMEGLSSAMKLLDSRATPNAVTSVYLISDVNYQLTEPDIYQMVVSECAASEVSIHTFGVSLNHSPDVLGRTSVTTGGSYFYVKEWKQLEECVSGRLRADQSLTHRNVELKLDTTDSAIRVTSVNGCDSTVNTDVLEGFNGSKPKQRLIRSFQPSNLERVPLGALSAGQTRSFLVQVSIPPRKVLGKLSTGDFLQLFSLKITYGGFNEPAAAAVTHKHVGVATIKLNMDATANSLVDDPPLTPMTPLTPMDSLRQSIMQLPPISDAPPSPIYGDIVYAGNSGSAGDTASMLLSVPMFLQVEKHNTHVVRRRLQLAAARNFESALQCMSYGRHEQAITVLTESRPILKGLLEISATAGTDKADDLLYWETKELAETLDRDVATICEKLRKPVLFEQDGRKWVIQTISILRSQLAFTSRSQIETLFFQCQQEVNVF